LETHQVPDAWAVAPALAQANQPVSSLDELAAIVNPVALPGAVTSFANSLNARSMVAAVSESSSRIFNIINSIKDYSYMDQAPIQDVDLVQSLENTLTLLRPQLQQMVIVRELADHRRLLRILRAPGRSAEALQKIPFSLRHGAIGFGP